VSSRVCVFGLWHLGCVTAACLAEQGLDVIGLDLDQDRIALLASGHAPIAEPGLDVLIRAGLSNGQLAFTGDPAQACAQADVLWVTFDTPVDDEDRADVAWVSAQLDAIRPFVAAGTLILISSQVPVGFTRDLEQRWRHDDSTLRFACVPENLRLGQALQVFRSPDRVVVGLGSEARREDVQPLLGTAGDLIVWMSIESAEMTKHALNGFLAASVAYTNEVARLCELVGADAAEVEQGLRTEPRIGRRAYVTPGAPIGGGTLARDVAYLKQVAADHDVEAPVLSGILASNRLHAGWARARAGELLAGIAHPTVAMLGLTYKAGTDTLRRSTAIELARELVEDGASLRAYDPAVHSLPADLDWMPLASSAADALEGTDLMIVGTAWPEFRTINGDQLVRVMRRPQIIDQTGFLPHLVDDRRLQYVRVGHRSRAEVRLA
jgi:UDPglucose 6-dehydrogenase